MTAQDQALQTKYYATKTLNTETDSKYRLCHQSDETTDFIISACPVLAKEQYTKRHDRVCAQPMQGNMGIIGQKKNTGMNMYQNQ